MNLIHRPIIIVCGGRDFADEALVFHVLDEIKPVKVIHGACGVDKSRQNWHKMKGTDRHADNWCILRGVEVVAMPADWTRFGVSAGPKRNKEMLALKPDLVVAFPGGRGTANMVELARAAGIEVREVRGA